MQLTLGRDIGIVMAKGVVLGVLSTIFILPSLLMFFDKTIEKYKHKTILNELHRVPRFVIHHYKKNSCCLCVDLHSVWIWSGTYKYLL